MLSSFILSVLAGMVASYICKWLDQMKNMVLEFLLSHENADRQMPDQTYHDEFHDELQKNSDSLQEKEHCNNRRIQKADKSIRLS